MSKCRVCDRNLSQGADLCPNCGAPVGVVSPHSAEDRDVCKVDRQVSDVTRILNAM